MTSIKSLLTSIVILAWTLPSSNAETCSDETSGTCQNRACKERFTRIPRHSKRGQDAFCQGIGMVMVDFECSSSSNSFVYQGDDLRGAREINGVTYHTGVMCRYKSKRMLGKTTIHAKVVCMHQDALINDAGGNLVTAARTCGDLEGNGDTCKKLTLTDTLKDVGSTQEHTRAVQCPEGYKVIDQGCRNRNPQFFVTRQNKMTGISDRSATGVECVVAAKGFVNNFHKRDVPIEVTAFCVRDEVYNPPQSDGSLLIRKPGNGGTHENFAFGDSSRKEEINVRRCSPNFEKLIGTSCRYTERDSSSFRIGTVNTDFLVFENNFEAFERLVYTCESTFRGANSLHKVKASFRFDVFCAQRDHYDRLMDQCPQTNGFGF